jgi:hypothetical protein
MTNPEAMWLASRAWIIGVVYLVYLAGVEVAWVSAGRLPSLCNVALLLVNVSYLVLAILFYNLFLPVSRRVSLEAALFGVAGSTLGILHVYGVASEIRTIPFLAGFLVLIGFLIARSAFLPTALGVLVGMTGVGWLAYLVPAIAARTHGHMSDFSFAAEGMFALWLLIKGVDVARWREQAGVPTAA